MDRTELPKANLNLSTAWFIKYYFFRILGNLLSRFKSFPKITNRLKSFANSVTRATYSEFYYRKNKKRALGDSTNAASFDSGYGYDDSKEEERVALMYKNDIVTGVHTNRESPALYKQVNKVLSDAINKHGIKRIIDFGVSYAYVDSVLAKKFPDVEFIGIDRSKAIQELNQKEFQDYKNMSFHAGDIMEWISAQENLNDALFFSMRTCILLPKNFIDSLYGKLSEKGLKAIAGFEPYGFSRETNSVYEQDLSDKKSVLFRDKLYIHNYVGLATKNGYDLDLLEYLKTNHIDADVRILTFLASLKK